MLTIYVQSAEGQEENGVSAEPGTVTRCGVAEMTILTKSLHLKCRLYRSSVSRPSRATLLMTLMGPKHISVLEGGSSRAEVAHFKCIIPRYTAKSLFTNGPFFFCRTLKLIAEIRRSSLNWRQLEKKDHILLKTTLST